MKRIAESENEFWNRFYEMSETGVTTETHGIRYPMMRIIGGYGYIALSAEKKLYYSEGACVEYLKELEIQALERAVAADAVEVVCLSGVFDPSVVRRLHEPKGNSWK